MKGDIRDISRLARLALSDEEAQAFEAQLGRILEYVETLNELDTSQVEPTTHILPLEVALRDDEALPSLPVKVALDNAPASDEGAFVVPRVV